MKPEPARILLVKDDESLRLMLADELCDNGDSVATAAANKLGDVVLAGAARCVRDVGDRMGRA